MPLTETEIKKIREEAERLYPDPPPYKNTRCVSLEKNAKDQREVHIAAVTKERERAKVLAIDFSKWCNAELWKHEHAEQRTFTDDEKYFYFIKQYNQ